MSSDKTTNLALHKWAGTDTVERMEFNDNFGTIDNKIGEHSAQIADIAKVTLSIDKYPRLGPESNDSGRFQRAFDYLVTQGGGIVRLPVGVYVANIKVPSNCGMTGQGRKSVIKCPNNSTSGVIELYDANVRNIYLNNFSIDGNKANQTSSNARGFYIKGNGSYSSSNDPANPTVTNDARHYIQDIFIANTKGTGFHLEGRGECNIVNVNVLASDDYGFYLNAFDNVFERLSSGANTKTGIYIGSSSFNCRFVTCKSWNNAVYSGNSLTNGFGFWLEQCEGVILSGCEAQANFHHGFYFNTCRNVVGVGLNSEWNGDGGVDTCGYALNATKNCTIVGGVRNGTGTFQDYAVGLYDFSDYNNIIVSCYQMTTGAVHNPQNRSLNNIQINGDRRYMESNYDYLSVGPTINKALAKFQVEGKRGDNVSSALISKNFNGDLSEDEILRLQAWDGGSVYHSPLIIRHNMTTESTRMLARKRLFFEKEVQIGDGLWNGQRLQLGNYNFWIDTAGRLRIKNGAPTSETDGTIVGSQA